MNNFVQQSLDPSQLTNLQAQVEFLERIINLNPNVIFVKDRAGRFVFANLACAEFLGKAVEEILGKTNAELSDYQAETENFVDQDQNVLTSLTQQFIEEEACHTGTGEWRWYQTIKTPFLSQNAQEYQVLGVCANITERKLAEEKLASSEAQLRLALKTSQMGFWERSIQTGLLEGSLHLEQLYGYPSDRYHSTSALLEIIHPEDRDHLQAAYQHAVATGKEFDVEFRVIRPDGSVRWIETKGQSIYDETGKPLRVTGVDLDITERKLAEQEREQLLQQIEQQNQILEAQVAERTAELEQANAQLRAEVTERQQVEKALRESEQQFRQIAENVQEVFWMKSIGSAELLYVSPAYEKVWGRSCALEEPDYWIDAIHPEDKQRVVASLEKRQEGTYDEEYRILHPDGSIRWVRDRIFPVCNERDELYRIVGITEDITVYKQAEEETFKALQRERELSEAKSRFIAMTSHDLRTPLATIQSSTDLLKRYPEQLSSEKYLIHLERISTAVETLTQMMQDVLTLSEAESGQLQFNPAPLNLVKLCQGLVSELLATDNKQHRITFTPHSNCNAHSFQESSEDLASIQPSLDGKLLRYILGNLLSNALKYSPKESSIQFDLIYRSEQVIFRIQDQGIGIPPKAISHLFESFYRASNVGATQGTGLGLSIVKQCVELHQGTIEMESAEGAGTTFVVTLPVAHP
jgi:PAS domain S-box-containing protein